MTARTARAILIGSSVAAFGILMFAAGAFFAGRPAEVYGDEPVLKIIGGTP